MYGLPQVGILTNNLLAQRLIYHGYYHVHHPPGLWPHVCRSIYFTFLVDNFGIGYVGQDHVDHLRSALKNYYDDITTHLEGRLYFGILKKWEYTRRYVDVSMTGYVKK